MIIQSTLWAFEVEVIIEGTDFIEEGLWLRKEYSSEPNRHVGRNERVGGKNFVETPTDLDSVRKT